MRANFAIQVTQNNMQCVIHNKVFVKLHRSCVSTTFRHCINTDISNQDIYDQILQRIRMMK